MPPSKSRGETRWLNVVEVAFTSISEKSPTGSPDGANKPLASSSCRSSSVSCMRGRWSDRKREGLRRFVNVVVNIVNIQSQADEMGKCSRNGTASPASIIVMGCENMSILSVKTACSVLGRTLSGVVTELLGPMIGWLYGEPGLLIQSNSAQLWILPETF